jgi:hypothetical protein
MPLLNGKQLVEAASMISSVLHPPRLLSVVTTMATGGQADTRGTTGVQGSGAVDGFVLDRRCPPLLKPYSNVNTQC